MAGPDIHLGKCFYINIQYKRFVTLLSVSFINIFPKGMYIFSQKAYGIKFDIALKWSRSPKVIIWTNFVGPKSPMLHTISQGHCSFGSREDIFTIYGHGGKSRPFGHVTQTPRKTFISPTHGDSIWNLVSIVNNKYFFTQISNTSILCKQIVSVTAVVQVDFPAYALSIYA